MSKNRRFHGAPVRLLIVRVKATTIAQVDRLINNRLYLTYRHPALGNRSEFVRMAIAEKLERDRLMTR
jgi:hypothetical protein